MKSLRVSHSHKAVKASPSMPGMRLQRGYSLMVTLLTIAGLSAGGVGYYAQQDGKIDEINAYHQRTGIELETITSQVYGYYKANAAWPDALSPAIGSQLQRAQSTRWTRCNATGTAFVTPDCTPITGALIADGSTYQITANYSTAEMAAVVVGIVPGADISTSNPSSVVVTLQPPVEWPGNEQWLARAPVSRANQLETDIYLSGNDIKNIDTLNAVTLNIIDPNAAANTPSASITAIGSTLNLNDDVNISGGLNVAGAVNGQNSLTVDGAFQANSTAAVAGALHAQDSLTVDGAFQANSTVTVVGALHAQDSLTVDGAFLANSSATVAGALHAQDSLTVDGALHAKDNLTVDGALHAKNTLTVDGALHAKNDLSVDGLLNAGTVNAVTLNADNANLTGVLNASQINIGTDGASISATGSTLNLGPSVNITGDLGVGGALDLNGVLELAGQLSVEGMINAENIAADNISASDSVSTPLINIGNTSIDSNGTTLQLNADTVYFNGQSTLGGDLDANGNDMIGINTMTVNTATIGDLTADNLTVTEQLIASATTLGSAAITGNLDSSADASFALLSASEVTADTGNFSKLLTTDLTANNATFTKADIATLDVTGEATVQQLGAASGNIGAVSADKLKATWSTSDTITTDQLHTFNGETLALDLPDLSATNLAVRDHLQVDNSASFTSGSTTGDLTAKSVSAENLAVAGLLETQNLTVKIASLGTTDVTGNFTSTGNMQSTSVEVVNQMRATGEISGSSFTATGLARGSDFIIERDGSVYASVDANRTSADEYYDQLDHCVNTSKFCIPQQPEATIKCRATYNCGGGASTSKNYTVYLDADISACRQGCKYYWRMPDPDGIERLHLPTFKCAVALDEKEWKPILAGQTAKSQCQVDFSDVPPEREVRGSVLLIVKNSHYGAPVGEAGSWKVVKEFYVSYTNTTPKTPAESTDSVAGA